MKHFFAPKSVAVIGATDSSPSVGRTLLENLATFPGPVYPVNPNHDQVLGRKAYPSVAAIGQPVDLAMIVTKAAIVPTVVAECAAAKVPAAIIISAGFKELGEKGQERERAIQSVRGSMRILGPNCLGVMAPHAGLNATFAGTMARPGSIAFLSQSGALCTAILDWSLRVMVGFSAFVSTGSMLDVGWGDLIDYLGDDPATTAILMYMESIGDARSFLSAAREVALTKPIIVIKAGRTEQAAKAAASHTGALTGSDDVLDAALRRCGVLRVDTISDLFDMTEALAYQPRPKGKRLAIVTNAGGPGVLATDALIGQGGELAQLAPETIAALDLVLPKHWSRQNPVDIIGDAPPERYCKALQIVANDPAADGVLVALAPQGMTDPSEAATQITCVAKMPGKPLLASWMGGASIERGNEILNAAGIPTFAFPDQAARAFVYMWQYSENLRALYETPELAGASPDRGRAAALLEAARATGRTLLTETEAEQLLAAYGIPATRTETADAYELILGSSIDAQFGPVLHFGAGGKFVEVFRDRALGLPPLTTTLARRMMERTRIYKALVDHAVLEQTLVRFSQLVAEQPRIKEIDINPLLTLNARVVLHDWEIADGNLPRTAIRPYPSAYVKSFTARNGAVVTIRPIRPDDEPAVVHFHETLSDRSVYMRYFQHLRLSQRVAHERLTRICFIDYDREMILVAETADREIVAAGRLTRVHGTNDAEFAVLVSDPWQHRGLGKELIHSVVEIARKEKVRRIWGHILGDNRPMQELARQSDLELRYSMEEGVVEASLLLSE